MSVWFLVAFLKNRNDVADIAWGLGFVFLTWLSVFISGTFGYRTFWVQALVSIWGLRLAWHIHGRNKGKPEDYRYQAWRREWGRWFYVRSYFQVYLLQGFFLFLIALPILLINRATDTPLGLLDLTGILVWSVGFFFEAVSDWQLSEFIRQPKNKGKLMQSGLWNYSRHPNYFGEVTLWWGIWLMALSVPGALLSIIGPLTITILILKVSGIPLLEQKKAGNPEFEAYKKRVNKFFPRL
ncbi:MAG: DUF1295 domain-containing protein [Myxococcaceae bacterium]